MKPDERCKEAQQLAITAIENYKSTVEAMIILDAAATILKVTLDKGYYTKHPDERPPQRTQGTLS